MQISKPTYFSSFRCIAGACPDSCCKEWDVQVDAASAALYRSLPGALGDRLRSVLVTWDGETTMSIENGRCPMWRSDGLCRIQAELGEDALCHVCREFPRLTHDYGDFVEYGLELSCPEAARLILTAAPSPMITQTVPGGEPPEYDTEAMSVLKETREICLSLLEDTTRPVPQALALVLLYGCQAQSQLDGGEFFPFLPEDALEDAFALAKPGDMAPVLSLFQSLELLTPQWEAALRSPAPGSWTDTHLALARYFIERYWLQAVSDYDLYSRVKLAILSCLVIRHLGGDIFRSAQLYSKEIENNADNLEALLDAAYTHSALTDDKLLGLLLLD